MKLEVDAATVFFPVAVAGGVGAIAAATDFWHLSGLGRVRDLIMVMLIVRLGGQQIRQLDGIARRNVLRAGWFDADRRSRHGGDRKTLEGNRLG